MSNSASENSIFKHTFKWGVVLGITGVIYYIIIYFTGQMSNSKVSWLLSPVLFIISLASVMQYRKTYLGGYISFGTAFKMSYLPYLYSFIINSIYQLVFIKFIMTPAVIDKVMQEMTDKLRLQGLADSQIAFSVKLSRMMFENPVLAIGATLLSFILVGAVISLIVAAICKKENAQAIFDEA